MSWRIVLPCIGVVLVVIALMITDMGLSLVLSLVSLGLGLVSVLVPENDGPRPKKRRVLKLPLGRDLYDHHNQINRLKRK